ncbi:histidine phosphatase family protein [Patescibacteria group bacterium]
MSRPSLLVIVRHAESMRNKAKRAGEKKGIAHFLDEDSRKHVKGIPDHHIALSEEGREQALQTGIGIRERFGTFNYIYHSGYKRTVETMDGILAAYTEEEQARMRIRQNLFIRERDSGFAYDMIDPVVKKVFPWLKEYWDTFGGFFAHPPGGESLAQVAERVYLFLNMLVRDRAGKKILVVTHGGTIRSFRFLLERWDYDRATKWPRGESPKNCGLTVYEFDPEVDRMILKEYNTIFWTPPEE